MRALFLRLFGGLLLALTLALPIVLFIILRQYAGTEEARSERNLRYTLNIIAERLRATADEDRPPLLAQIAREAGLRVTLEPTEALDPALRARLADGHPAATMGMSGVLVVRRRLDAQQVIALHLPPLALRYSAQPLLTATLGLLTLAVGLMVAIWPIQRELQRLATAAERLGAGDLSVRVGSRDKGPVGELARTFDQMADRIQRGMNEQKSLLHAVSHELRTPLARLRFGAALLEREQDPERRARQAADLDRDVSELDDLVEELLSFARLDQSGPPLRPEPLSLRALLDELAERDLPLYPERQITVDAAPEAVIFADRRLLSRAVGNLLINAARHASSQVLLRGARADGGWRIEVEDDGPGILPSERERIFLPFVRLEADRGRTSGGAGLGLAIVARIACLHGGEVHAEASPLGGARLTLWLPEAQATQVPGVAAPVLLHRHM